MSFHSYFERLASFSSLFAALVLIPVAWSAEARATPAGEVVTKVVQYDDLNIKSETGRQALLRRVKVAVDRVCAETTFPRGLRQREYRECRRQAWQGAMSQIDWPATPAANAVRIEVAPFATTSAASSNESRNLGTLNHKGVFIPAP